ncbi:hypothetical protein GCM10009097_06610 [Pigmentiphaga daeguensis]|uniref:Uncharacterized protein n=2 Tax=Pigmentiphaga daeguensis TaxID=414049 RepID=A0ABN1BA80_9BURK
MPRYICHKQVWALKIESVQEGVKDKNSVLLTFADEGYAPIHVDFDWYYRHKPEAGGYYVVYKDGYKSFSPAAAFEDGYTLQGAALAPQNDDETEGLRAHIALLKASLAQCERELDELRVAAQAPQEPEEPLPPPGIHAAVHYAGWLRREAHRHQEPKAGVLRQAARMLDVLKAECGRLHQELIDAQAPAVPPEKPLPDLMMASYHEAVGWNACRAAMLANSPAVAPAVPEESTTAARDEFPMLYDSLDALDERAAEQPERIGTQRHLSSLRTSIQAVVQKLSLARARISDLESAASAEPVALDRDTLVDLIAVHLSGTYHCTRVWSAWSFGTMSEDDFEDVSESDTPSELADAILARLAAPVADQAPQDERMETTSEHIARDIREGRFPQRSEPQRVQATEWGPMPDAGVEADAHVAVIEGDEAVRVLRWNSDVGAFSYPVGTRLYAAQAPAADGDALRADPLQGAADWLVEALAKPRPTEIAARLLIGYNRASRLYDAAMQRTTGSEK